MGKQICRVHTVSHLNFTLETIPPESAPSKHTHPWNIKTLIDFSKHSEIKVTRGNSQPTLTHPVPHIQALLYGHDQPGIIFLQINSASIQW